MSQRESGSASQSASLLEIRDVTVRFGGQEAMSRINLTAEAGTITGLIGPNGAGKTTTFNVITGLMRPTSGDIAFDGQVITKLPTYKRARLGMARTFQRLELFSQLSVRENIAVAAGLHGQWSDRIRQDDRLVQSLLEGVGLTEIADERADTLSTGQGRLVEIARALAIQPKLLLLDEPASGQDAHETARFAELLHALADDGVAILLVEHDVDLVMQVCQKIFVLDFGRMIASGAPDQIQADPQVRAAYLGTGAAA
jgi:branched-chain amino acid transport system ATP-binding protein